MNCGCRATGLKCLGYITAARSTGVNSKVNVYACSLTVSFWCHLLAFRQNIKFCDLNYVFWKAGKKTLVVCQHCKQIPPKLLCYVGVIHVLKQNCRNIITMSLEHTPLCLSNIVIVKQCQFSNFLLGFQQLLIQF